MSSIGVETFRCRLENVINVHREAEDLTNAEVIGVLELIKLDLHKEMTEDEEGDYCRVIGSVLSGPEEIKYFFREQKK